MRNQDQHYCQEQVAMQQLSWLQWDLNHLLFQATLANQHSNLLSVALIRSIQVHQLLWIKQAVLLMKEVLIEILLQIICKLLLQLLQFPHKCLLFKVILLLLKTKLKLRIIHLYLLIQILLVNSINLIIMRIWVQIYLQTPFQQQYYHLNLPNFFQNIHKWFISNSNNNNN